MTTEVNQPYAPPQMPSATPAMLKARRDYAEALMGKKQQNVGSPWQGGANLMGTLGGALLNRSTNDLERQALYETGQRVQPDAGDTRDPYSGIPGRQGGGGTSSTSPFSGAGGPMGSSQTSPGLAQVEAGGHKFTASSTAAPRFQGFLNELVSLGAPIHDVGGYGYRKIAGTNTLSEHAGGNAIDVNQSARNVVTADFEQWLSTHQKEFRAALDRHGIASGGDWRNADLGHFELAKGFKGAPPSPSGGQALAFNGEPSDLGGGPAMPQGAQVVAAAGGGGRGGGSMGVPGGQAPPVPGAPVSRAGPGGDEIPYLDPRNLPHRVPVPYGGAAGAIADPFMPDWMKKDIYEKYYEQRQPLQLKGPGGTYNISPQGGQPTWIPELQKWEMKTPGGGSMPGFGTFGPTGKLTPYGGIEVPPVPSDPSEGPPPLKEYEPMGGAPPPAQSGTPPPAGPAGATSTGGASPTPPAGASPAATGGTSSGRPLPPLPPGTVVGPAPAKATPPPAAPAASPGTIRHPTGPAGMLPYAANEGADKTGVPWPLKAGEPGASGLFGAEPPKFAEAGNGVVPPPPGEKTAEAGGNYFQQQYERGMQQGLRYEQQKTVNDKDAELFVKNADQLSSAGLLASKTKPNLVQMRTMIEDPYMNQGIFATPLQWFSKVMNAVGMDPKAGAVNDAFGKLRSENVLNQLKEKLQGLGQVRIAEIDLLTKASADQHNTLYANRAVLNLQIRANEMTENIGNVTNAYRQGYVMGEGGKWQKFQGPQTNAGLREAIQKYVDKNPLMRPEESKEFWRLMEEDKKYPIPKSPTGTVRHPNG